MARQHSGRFESNAESAGEFDGVGRSTGPNYIHQEGYSGHSCGYVQDSVYVGKSHDRSNVHVPMSQLQQGWIGKICLLHIHLAC